MTALDVVTKLSSYGTYLALRSGDDKLTLDECAQFVASHPVIVDSAPPWARSIEVLEILDDGSGAYFYVFKDERFEVTESWYIQADGSLVYGHNNDDEPEITSYDDALLELVTAYIEGKEPAR